MIVGCSESLRVCALAARERRALIVKLGEQLSPETAGITFETAGISPEIDQISQRRNPAGSHIIYSLALARSGS